MEWLIRRRGGIVGGYCACCRLTPAARCIPGMRCCAAAAQCACGKAACCELLPSAGGRRAGCCQGVCALPKAGAAEVLPVTMSRPAACRLLLFPGGRRAGCRRAMCAPCGSLGSCRSSAQSGMQPLATLGTAAGQPGRPAAAPSPLGRKSRWGSCMPDVHVVLTWLARWSWPVCRGCCSCPSAPAFGRRRAWALPASSAAKCAASWRCMADWQHERPQLQNVRRLL